MNLKNKKLLLMGGSAFSQSLKKYAEIEGFTMIAIGNKVDTPHKKITNNSYLIDTHNVNGVLKIVKEEKCDGIFVGALEANIIPAIQVAKKAGINFYTDETLWNIMSNKRLFKNLLKKHDIEITKEYDLSLDFLDDDLNKIEYPVIVKPVDGSGARGISVCKNIDELKNGYRTACSVSWTNSVVVEKYITGMTDMFIHYTLIDGEYSLAATFDRNLNYSQGGFTGMAVAYTYPSLFTNQYINIIDAKMKNAFKDAGLKNGCINIQCFTDGNHFYFYESGYRLGGEQMYFFTEELTGINVCNLMINQALTGKMSDTKETLKLDDPLFKKPCLCLYVALKPGIVTTLNGLDNVRSIRGVLNVTEMFKVGTKVVEDGSLNQVCLRMHLMADSTSDLARIVDNVYDNLSILDEFGNDMIMEHFDLRKTDYFTEYENIIRDRKKL